jgi:hypothetical protein
MTERQRIALFAAGTFLFATLGLVAVAYVDQCDMQRCKQVSSVESCDKALHP